MSREISGNETVAMQSFRKDTDRCTEFLLSALLSSIARRFGALALFGSQMPEARPWFHVSFVPKTSGTSHRRFPRPSRLSAFTLEPESNIAINMCTWYPDGAKVPSGNYVWKVDNSILYSSYREQSCQGLGLWNWFSGHRIDLLIAIVGFRQLEWSCHVHMWLELLLLDDGKICAKQRAIRQRLFQQKLRGRYVRRLLMWKAGKWILSKAADAKPRWRYLGIWHGLSRSVDWLIWLGDLWAKGNGFLAAIAHVEEYKQWWLPCSWNGIVVCLPPPSRSN